MHGERVNGAAGAIIDVSVGFVGGRSTVDLIVGHWRRNTFCVTDADVEVHQATAARQMLALGQPNDNNNYTVSQKNRTLNSSHNFPKW